MPRHELSDEAIRRAVKVLRKAQIPNDDPDAEPGSPEALTRIREVRDAQHRSTRHPQLRN